MWHSRRDGGRFSGSISAAVCPSLPILYDPIMKSLHNLNAACALPHTMFWAGAGHDLEGADLM